VPSEGLLSRSVCLLSFPPPIYTDICDWKLKLNISLETREVGNGSLEYWAYADVMHFSVYTLAQVLPLVDQDIPHSNVVQEDAGAVRIHPTVDLAVKEANSWRQSYPNLRIRSMNVSMVEGYEPGSDLITLPDVPGFTSEFFPENGVLRISTVPGYDFTDNTAEDYNDDVVELVDVGEFIHSAQATATLANFNEVLRQVDFRTTTLGRSDRIMELSINELLTADTIARISFTQVVNDPDPPEVHPTDFDGVIIEKAAPSPLDADVEVFHPDYQQIASGVLRMQPLHPGDVLVYSPPADDPELASLLVSLNPADRSWTVSGLADAEVYTRAFQSFMLSNEGPTVDVSGSTLRTVTFQIEDELGATVSVWVGRGLMDPPQLVS
jgi:hypothetical protein